jgi:hypothetical protein
MFPNTTSSVASFIVAAIVQASPVAEPVEPLWRIVLRDFPRDAAAITLYIFLAFSIGLVWWAHRRSRAGVGPEARDDEGRNDEDAPRTAAPAADGPGRGGGERGPRRPGRAA